MIEKSVLLACDEARAFRLFTEKISEWWPAGRRHTNDAQSVLTLDARRFVERARDGREVPLGRVRVWEPPTRIVLDWYPGTDVDHPTEVEIRFERGERGTRVHVCHRPTAASVDLFDTRAPRYLASWELVLAALERAPLEI